MTLDDLTSAQLKTLRDQAAGMARTFGRRRGLTAEDIEDIESELRLYLLEHVDGFDPTRAGWVTYCQRRAVSGLSKLMGNIFASKRRLDRVAVPLTGSGPDGSYDLGDKAVRWRTPPTLQAVAAEAAAPIVRHGRPVEVFDRSRPSPEAPKPWDKMSCGELRRQLTARGARHKGARREVLLKYMNEAMKDESSMLDTFETLPIMTLREIARRFGISEFRTRDELAKLLPEPLSNGWAARNAAKHGVSTRRSRDELIGLLKQKGISAMEDVQTVTPEPEAPPKRERPKPPAAPGTKIEPGDPDPAQDGTPLADTPVPGPQSGQFHPGNPDLVDGARLAAHLGVTTDAIDAARRAGVIAYTHARGPKIVSGGVPVPPKTMQGWYRLSEITADARAWLRSWQSPVRTEAAPTLPEQDPLLPARQLADEYGISERELLRLISTGTLPAWPLLQPDGSYRWFSLPSAFRHVAALGRLVSL